MPNVDDSVFDWTLDLAKEIFECALSWVPEKERKREHPTEKQLWEWRNKLFFYDVSTWTPREDDRSAPGRIYKNRLYDVLEFQAYEVKSEMMKWVKGEDEEKSA
jgi:hypothetical protein